MLCTYLLLFNFQWPFRFPLLRTAWLLYHTSLRLSSTFWKFLLKIFPSSVCSVCRLFSRLAYSTTFLPVLSRGFYKKIFFSPSFGVFVQRKQFMPVFSNHFDQERCPSFLTKLPESAIIYLSDPPFIHKEFYEKRVTFYFSLFVFIIYMGM